MGIEAIYWDALLALCSFYLRQATNSQTPNFIMIMKKFIRLREIIKQFIMVLMTTRFLDISVASIGLALNSRRADGREIGYVPAPQSGWPRS